MNRVAQRKLAVVPKIPLDVLEQLYQNYPQYPRLRNSPYITKGMALNLIQLSIAHERARCRRIATKHGSDSASEEMAIE